MHKEAGKKITINIVTSIIGYGVYFPARIIYEQLKARDYDVHIYIIERYFETKAMSEFERTKSSFKKDVRLVRIASRIPVSYVSKLNAEKTKALFKEWTANSSTHFLCFSGLWLETLQEYKKIHSDCIIDCCRVDSAVSSTWGTLSSLRDIITNDLSFFSSSAQKIKYVLNIPELQTIPYSARENEVIIHGGGWSLGDFISTKDQFTDAYHVNLIVHKIEAGISEDEHVTLYANEPEWNPLYKDGFPAFGKIFKNGTAQFNTSQKHPGILKVIAKSKAIVSKPGGMTLMDSLISETPLLFLKSVGKNEDANKILWETLQLGIPIDVWQKHKDKGAILREIQQRIVAIKEETPCFLKTYMNLLEKEKHTYYATKKY